MNREKWIEQAKSFTDDNLRKILGGLEADKEMAINFVGEIHPFVHHITIMMDVVCGELINRDKIARNSKEPKWNTPKCPETFLQLMSLGNGEMK